MIRPRPPVFVAALLGLALLTAPIGAPASAQEAEVVLRPDAVDLLPLGTFESQDFNREHGGILGQVKAFRDRLGRLYRDRAKLQRKKKRSKAEAKRLADLGKQIRATSTQLAAVMARVTTELREDGIDARVVRYLNESPRGARRAQRHAQGLVMLVEDLTPGQQWLFDRVLACMEGAYASNAAQRERTSLALQQTDLDATRRRGVLGTFDRQMRVMEGRFWLLVDCVLDRDQRVWIHEHLPASMRTKSQAQEHLYQLPGLSPTQATRLRALLTEVEHEMSPDLAAVRRIRAQLATKDKPVPAKERAALSKERGAAYARINTLRRFQREEVRKILTEEQQRAYAAIPPYVSTNERGASYNRLFSSWKPTGRQQAAITRLQRARRTAARAASKDMNLARKQGEDFGPDSPQMMSMEMAMNGARAEQAAASRELAGAIFQEVMTLDEVCAWVLGHWGYKR